MKLYLAGYSTGRKFFHQCKCFNKINFLESYLYFKNKSIKDDYILYEKKFFLDSGAFTAYTQKKEIDIEEYCNFIKKNIQFIEQYANLDVIGDAEKTWENQCIMEKRGLKPLPTYHYGEPVEWFEKYVKEYDYIGIGGLVPHARKPKNIEAILDYVFYYIFKNKLKTKIHGRGMTNPRFIKKYPFYSVDSTGWLAGGKFNTIYFYKNGELTSDNAQGIRKRFGVDFGRITYQQKNILNIEALYQYVDYVSQLHKVKGMEYWN